MLIKLFQYNKIIRGILGECFPSQLYISTTDIHNLKLWCLQYKGGEVINTDDIELKGDSFDFWVKDIDEQDLLSNMAVIFQEMLSASVEGWKSLHILKLAINEKDAVVDLLCGIS